MWGDMSNGRIAIAIAIGIGIGIAIGIVYYDYCASYV